MLQNTFAGALVLAALCTEYQCSFQLSQTKYFLHILLDSKELPVRNDTHTHTHTETPYPLENKQTALLKKGLITALYLAMLLQCWIP